MYACFMCMCATCMPRSLRGQKREFSSLELEFWVIVNTMWVLEIELGSPARTSKALSH